MKIMGLSKRGIKEVNEDCYSIDNKCFYNEKVMLDKALSLFVFDGVSTSNDGKNASLLAANIVANSYEKLFEYSDNEIKSLLKDINDKIISENIGSTTIAGFIIFGSNLKIINMGDSKVYRVREGLLKKLTVDDTYYEYLKSINNENYNQYENSHIITSCLGMPNFDCNNIHLKEVDFGIMEKDVLFVCSDGVSDLINETELVSILDSDDSLEKKVDIMDKLIIDRGMHDNYTLIIMEV